MDAEFVEFLDKKFQRVEKQIEGVRTDLEGKIQQVHLDLKGDIGVLDRRLSRLEESVERLAHSIERMLRMWEELATEQKTILADITRIKAIIKEKLGIEV